MKADISLRVRAVESESHDCTPDQSSHGFVVLHPYYLAEFAVRRECSVEDSFAKYYITGRIIRFVSIMHSA